MRYVISGGGTGGHIYPALAIAMEIKKQDKDAEILYIGTRNGLESKLVPKEGINFKSIRVKGLPRKINIDFFKSIIEAFKGLNDARKILKDFKPDIVIGTGGYVSGPVLLQASMMGIKIIIHEQNAFPGKTNKILAKRADKIFITFEEARKYFNTKKDIILTGNPIRNTIFEINKEEAYKNNHIDKNKPVILSFGGSGGQKKLNDSILGYIKNNLKNDIQLYHVTGTRFYDDFKEEIKDFKFENLHIKPYAYNMPELLNIADLVITSSGAITLAELSALGKPSILTPKAYTAENHQVYNAEAFMKNGAAMVLYEDNLNAENLSKLIEEIIYDENKLLYMTEASKKMGRKDAAKEIVDLIINA